MAFIYPLGQLEGLWFFHLHLYFFILFIYPQAANSCSISTILVMGYRGRIGAWFVAFFLIGTAFMIHRFWAESDPMAAQIEMTNFLKNLIISGGAFMMTKTGTGPYSVDNLNKPA